MVQPVNDAPVITGTANDLVISDVAGLKLVPENFKVTDPDNIFPDQFTLKVLLGLHYTVNNDIVFSELNFKGSLTVGVKVSDGLKESNLYEAIVAVDIILGMEKEDQSKVNIFPNPSNGNFTFNVPELVGEKVTIAIINSTGQIIFRKEFFAEKENALRLNLPQGSYIFRVEKDVHVYFNKIVIR